VARVPVATRTDVRRLAEADRQIGRLATRDVRRLWSTLTVADALEVRDALETLLPGMVAVYGDLSATVAADWYDEVRASSGVGGRFRAEPAAPVAAEAVRANARWAIGPLFAQEPDWDGALERLTPEVGRMVAQQGRDTITRSTVKDRQAVGWKRVTNSPKPCKFCVALEARGAVYKEATVRFAAHTNCSCSVAPSWDKTAPEVPVEAYQASARTSQMSGEQLEAHRARTRAWLNREYPDIRG
jgi:hypothetical protein